MSTTTKFENSSLVLRLESVLQRHPDSIMYMAKKTEDNALVAVKCYKSSKYRDSEVFFYRKLASLQGVHTPRYLGSRILGDWDKSRLFALILTWVGDDWKAWEASDGG
jgi:hypothetical protein